MAIGNSFSKMYFGFVTVIFIFVISEVMIVSSKHGPGQACGPNSECTCNINWMDCSSTMLDLKHVCDSIDNTTVYNITSLLMQYNDLQIVGPLDLTGCEMLTELDLSSNNIRTIVDDTFSVLSHIHTLQLQRNNLSLFYDGTNIKTGFSTSLKTLYLNGNVNSSNEMFYPVLKDLPNLQTLYIDGLPHRDVPMSWRYLYKLQTVVFSGNLGYCNISGVTNDTFVNLPNILNLEVSACNIHDVHAGGFMSLRYLENLDISENMLLGFRSLRNISFSLQYTNIRMLNYSKIHTTFGLTTELKLRDLCYLRNTTLTELDVSSNRLGKMEANSLIVVPDSLKIFRANDNKFTFGLYLLQLGCVLNIEEFYGSYQNYPHNPERYNEEPQTNDVKRNIPLTDDCPFMSAGYLYNTSKTISTCRYFEPGQKVNVYKNHPFLPRLLKRVSFANSNMVYKIPAVPIFPFDNAIDYLDLSGNVFNVLVGPVGPFSKLKHLNLSKCYCSYIYGTFFNFMKPTLESLQLQHNNLGVHLANNETGSIIFNDFTALKVLNLSTNTIWYLPAGILSGAISLHTLDISNNNIERWSINVNHLTSLLHLKLSKNFIQSLPIEVLERLRLNSERLNTSFTVDLRYNTLKIDCKEKEFLQWIVKYKSNMVHFETYTFVDMNGAYISAEKFVETVVKLDKTCASYTIIILICSIGLSVYLAVLIGGVIYKNRWNIRYLLRNAKVRHYRYRRLNDVDDIQYRYDVFISYANPNVRFILDTLMPGLENRGFKLCVHDRDFLPGNNIADNIVEAISNSRKTVVVLSEEFMYSQWCLYEFNMARMESIYTRDQSGCLIVVLLENVPSDMMPNEMLAWIRCNTYVEYTDNERGEQVFWEQFQEALQ